jgi:predicted dehydrogenase
MNEHTHTRRDFLARTAAAAGAAAVLSAAGGASGVPAPAPRGRPGPPLKDGDPIRLGVIGTGGMGTGHCEAFCKLVKDGKEKAEIVAVADVCDIHAEGAKKKIEEVQGGPVATFRDAKKLLARDDIHAVVIATPEHWHSRNAIDAILAGKDVYLEKPMCLNLADALRLREVVRANSQRILQVGTQMMQLPKYQEARKMIAEGAIGKPTFSQTSYCRNSHDGEWNYYAINKDWKPGVNLDWDAWCGPAGKAPWDPKVYARWRRYRKYSTGIIGDLLVHQMTPLMMALDQGWPTRVVAGGGHLVDKDMENHDQVNLTVDFEKEHVMVVAGSTCNEVGVETMIRGHRGNIYLGDRHCTFRPERIFVEKENLEQKKIECPEIGNDQDLHRLHWLHCIRTREQPLADVELGTKVMVIVDLATRSLWEGGAFRFDPKTMKVKRA